MKHALLTLLTAAIALSACTSQKSQGPLNLALVGKPTDATTELAQLQRYRGQTQFLDRENRWRGMPGRPEAPGGASPRAPSPNQDSREQQESDVFKIGAAGSKLLYLMNQYRGLQVVSFAKGEEQPELLGRAATSGNSVDEMYSDLTRNRLISIEHDYKYADGKDQSHSMLVVYDVSKPTAPLKTRTIDVDGLAMDSRIVGDVLYVASREDDKGLVTSYSLTSTDLHQVEQHALSLPVAYGENMNIVQQGNDYFLVAVLADKGWGWWRNASVIDVVDISDSKGKIKPLMSVATRGYVRERSQTQIANRTLVVTSNYAPKETLPGQQEVLRIAVETFKFPESSSEILTDDEAQFRKLNIQRQVQGHYGTDLEQLTDKLMNDPTLGLKGRFVRANETLNKIVADSIVTVGDGSGLSAQLQDVRVQDGLLYAFWVPRDQIDPFDLFDMSHPENGITYLGRLHFDGWIERAIPFSNAGRKFVLGLGWIQPVVDNEDGRRVPQAMIFEIKTIGGKPKAVEMSQLSLEGSNIWTNFNGQDKMVEVRETTPGQGEILFAAERFEKNEFNGGGQIIRFDLSKVDTTDSLTQGPFLSGGAEWIRRVFTNPEINRINSFSDHALATFSSSRTPGDMHPVSILELARNVAGYEVVLGTGVQIVTDGYWGTVGATTSLRAVKTVDAEKAQALSTLEIPGTYDARIMIGDDLLVMTTQYQSGQQSDGTWKAQTTYRLTRVTAIAGSLKEVAHQEWIIGGYPDGVSLDSPLVRLADGTLLSSFGGVIRKLDVAQGLKAIDLALDASCVTTDRTNVSVKVMNGSAFLLSDESIDSKDFEDESFVRHYLAPVTVGAAAVSCQASYNIPGRVQTVTASGDVLVVDTWVTDMRKQENGFAVETQDSLFSLHLGNGVATLKDESVLAATPRFGGYRGGPMCPGCGWNSVATDFEAMGDKLISLTVDNGEGKLERVSVDSDSMIVKDVRTFATKLDADSVSSSFIVNGDSVMAVLKGDRQVQVVRWTAKDLRPEVLKLKPVNERGEVGDTDDILTLSGSWWSVGDLHYSEAVGSIEIAQGWNGLAQILLAK